jgi:hypothetical protein
MKLFRKFAELFLGIPFFLVLMLLISTSQIDLAVITLDDNTTPVPQTTARSPL